MKERQICMFNKVDDFIEIGHCILLFTKSLMFNKGREEVFVEVCVEIKFCSGHMTNKKCLFILCMLLNPM